MGGGHVTKRSIGLDDRRSSLRKGIVARVRKGGREYTVGLADLNFIAPDPTSQGHSVLSSDTDQRQCRPRLGCVTARSCRDVSFAGDAHEGDRGVA